MCLINDNYKNDKAVLFFPEDLLCEIHLLQNVTWGTRIFVTERKVWFIQSAPSEHQLEPEDPNHERMDSLTLLEFQTRMANPDCEGSNCLPFFRSEWGVQFKKRIGMAQETKQKKKPDRFLIRKLCPWGNQWLTSAQIIMWALGCCLAL